MSVSELLEQASEITERDPRAKGEAMDAIARQILAYGDAVLPELLEAKKSSNQLISTTAGIALNGLDTGATFDAMKTLLQASEGSTQQTFALNWIQHHPRPESVPLLKAIYDSNPHVSVKNKIVIVIGQMDYPEALAFLGEILQGYVTQDYEGISQSITAFNTLKKHEDREEIKALLDDYRKKSPRYLIQLIDFPGQDTAIVNALIEIGTPEAIQELVDFVNSIEVLDSDSLSKKDRHIRSLKLIHSPPAMVTDVINHYEANLLQYLTLALDSERFQYAVSQLCAKNSDDAFAILIERLQLADESWHKQRQQYIAQNLKHYRSNPLVAGALEKYEADSGN